MLRKLFERFFRRAWAAAEPEPLRLAYQVAGGLPPGPLPTRMVACVLRRGELVAVSREDAPRMDVGEVCWLLPTDDVPVPVVLELDGSPLAVEVTVRFETDPTIAGLLRDRTALVRDELAALLTSELAGLADMLGHANAEALTALDEDSRERLRAKLSLVLQAKGLRCTGLGAFEPAPPSVEPAVEVVEALKPVEEHVAAAVVAPRENSEPAEHDVAAAELRPALAAAILQVQDDGQWDELVAQIEASGMGLDESAADELDALGQSVVDRRIDAERAAERVAELAEAARRTAGVASPDLRRWQGLALRLRLLDLPPEPAAASSSDGQECPSYEPAAGESPVEATKTRRPWTWWMFRRSSIDTRLRQFLRDATRQTRTSLDAYRSRLEQIGHAARVKEVSDRFRLVEDLLETVPTLNPRQRQYRVDRERVKQVVQNIERAVTAAELAQAAVHALPAQPEGTADWQAALAEASAAVNTLDDQLRARRQVR